MRISIIVPNLSGEIYLPDCEDSIAAQGFPVRKDGNFRYVTGNGFEIEAIIENDPQDSPRGVAAMRNQGIMDASGDYILFLDSDDYLADGSIAVLAEQAGRHPDALIALTLKKTWYKRETELKESAGTGSDAGLKADQESKPEEKGSDARDRRQFTDSILGILIPFRYIREDAHLRFDESLEFYSDIPFVTGLFAGKEIICTEAVYYKRSRNDAIRYPALSQRGGSREFEDFAKACESAEEVLEGAADGSTTKASGSSKGAADGSTTKVAGDRECTAVDVEKLRNAFYDYICGFVCDRMLKGKHPEGLKWDVKCFDEVRRAVGVVPGSFINMNRHGTQRAVLEKIRKGKYTSAVRRASFSVMNRKKKGLFGSLSQWRWNIYKRLFRKLPVKKELYLFESFLGKSYGDSCRAIYEYMISHPETSGRLKDTDGKSSGSGKRGRRPVFVWIIDNGDAKIPGRHKEAKPLSLRYFYYVARCGAWINNTRQPAWYEKRPGVIFLETWHGTPLKRLVFDMEDVHSASPDYKMTFYKQSRIWDWLVSDNRFSTEAFESAFLFPRERILELGYPRNDLLYGDDREERAGKIREKLGIPKDRKVVLYAPTWRDDDYYGPGQYNFDLPLDLKVMERLKDRYFFILRTHYFIADHLRLNESEKQFVMDCSRYNDIGELYLISDVLITDYSSVFFDYANLRRPILFYVYDFEKYRDTLRGFYFDMETGCPGPLLKTSSEVAEALDDIENIGKEYAGKYREFTERFCSLDDGHAAERIVKKVFLDEKAD